jgi:hypothetical protein
MRHSHVTSDATLRDFTAGTKQDHDCFTLFSRDPRAKHADWPSTSSASTVVVSPQLNCVVFKLATANSSPFHCYYSRGVWLRRSDLAPITSDV